MLNQVNVDTILSSMTDLIYLTDSYKKSLKTSVVSVSKRGQVTEVILTQTVFYPIGGGQPSDKGEIIGKNGKITVKHVRMQQGEVIHEGILEGILVPGDTVECVIDWELRYYHMRLHSAGHIVHEAVMKAAPVLIPQKGEHGDHPYIEYKGSLTIDKKVEIEKIANEIVDMKKKLTTKFVTYDELVREAAYVPDHLPKHKPLRIVQVEGSAPIPDGGTQVHNAEEVGHIDITAIENTPETVKVHYAIVRTGRTKEAPQETVSSSNISSLILEVQNQVLTMIRESRLSTEELRLKILGSKSEFAQLTKSLRLVPPGDRQRIGMLINEVKNSIESALSEHNEKQVTQKNEFFDITMPGIQPPTGHLHIVTQAIVEISRIFERIGFTRVRHPEVDWDWYPFESLNMPPDHPARDEWETFFIETKSMKRVSSSAKKSKIVLTPHTSNGQVREMEKKHLPIRMINIAKCYRRQSDVSHVPMFHQFEGLYVDKNVSIGHLKGVFDYFVKQFFGPDRSSRIRPFHFQFTEPSFEIDISCGVCGGVGCRLCKEGWLELGGAGMVHPIVLQNGGIDTDIYNGFAFGWGVERTYMMKSGTKLDDIRLLYSNDIRFLEQF